MRIDPEVASSPVTRDVREAPSAAIKSGEEAPATATTRLQTLRAMLDKGDYLVDLDLLASRIVDDGVLRAGRS
jgi:hypothetical protein